MRSLLTLLRNILVNLLRSVRMFLYVIGLRPAVPDYVTFDLRDDPPYRSSGWHQRMAAIMAGRRSPADLRTLSRALDRLSFSKARGVIFRVDGLSTSLAKIEALAELARRARWKGKEVVVWTSGATSRDASLLFAGDLLFVPPSGRLDLRGFAAQATSAAPALDWLGVGVTVVRRGSYKTAADTLINEEASPELRETLLGILDDLHASLRQSLSRGRGVDEEEAARLIDQAPWSAEAALRAGLVDGVCYWDELPRALASRRAVVAAGPSSEEGEPVRDVVPSGESETSPDIDSVEVTECAADAEPATRSRRGRRPGEPLVQRWREASAAMPVRLDWRPLLSHRQLVAVVPIRGMIIEGESRQLLGGNLVGHRTIAEALSIARASPRIKAVVLHIDSRGGSALASDLMWREIRRTCREKPVVAFIENVAASGGYYCAAGATSIVASPLALTGSIGVIMVHMEISRLDEKIGVRREVFGRGERSALGTSSRPPTDEELEVMEREAQTFYDLFLDRVARGRPLSRQEVANVAEGRVFTARRAQQLDLVDDLGGFEQAVEKARVLAGFAPREATPLVSIEHAGGLFGGGVQVNRVASPSLEICMEGLGFDGFDAAWMASTARRPQAIWAVMPERPVDRSEPPAR